MFLNITGLKKYLKAAYKGSGLIVGNLDREMVIMNAAGTWGIQIDTIFVPNKLKGALAELIGDLPEEGEIYTYRPEDTQKELDLGRFDFYYQWKCAKDYAAQTPFILRCAWDEYALMQIHSTMELRPVSREYMDLISIKDLDHSNESMPGNPSYLNGILYWKNDTMIFWTGTSVLNEKMEELVIPRLAFLDCFGKELSLRLENLPYEEEV